MERTLFLALLLLTITANAQRSGLRVWNPVYTSVEFGLAPGNNENWAGAPLKLTRTFSDAGLPNRSVVQWNATVSAGFILNPRWRLGGGLGYQHALEPVVPVFAEVAYSNRQMERGVWLRGRLGYAIAPGDRVYVRSMHRYVPTTVPASGGLYARLDFGYRFTFRERFDVTPTLGLQRYGFGFRSYGVDEVVTFAGVRHEHLNVVLGCRFGMRW